MRLKNSGKKTNLRKLNWADIIVHFTILKDREEFSTKDLLDYFQYKKLEKLEIINWSNPNYRLQTNSAKKLLEIYGKELSVEIVNILFDKFELFYPPNKNICDLTIGTLSSENTGWLLDKIMLEYKKIKGNQDIDVYNRLLDKSQNQWTQEEFIEYQRILLSKKEKSIGTPA